MKLSKNLFLRALILGLSLTGHARDKGVEPIQEVFEPDASHYDSSKYGKVAVVQWNPETPSQVGISKSQAEAFKQANRKTLEGLVREAAAKGAKLVVTSEFGILGYPDIPNLPPEESDYRNRDDIAPYVESVPGPSTNYFSKVAKELGIYLHISFAEVDSNDRYYNVIVVLDPTGKIVAKFRKINLFELENSFLSAGSQPVTYQSIFGKIGLALCADIYSSNPMDAYARDKVDVVALSTSWVAFNSGMNAFEAGARRTHAYVLAANQNYFPDSGVINPDGTDQSHIRQSSGIAYGYLPYKSLR